MNYVIKITEIPDTNNNKSYYVFDSFGTFLGYFKNKSLAYDLIIAYFECLEKTYKVGEFSNVKKQVNEALNGKTNSKSQDYDSIEFIDEMIHSIKKVTKKEYEKEGDETFSSTPIRLGSEFRNVFDEKDINDVHWSVLKKIKDNKFKGDEKALTYFKEQVIGAPLENEFLKYINSLPDFTRNEEKRDSFKKEIKK